MGLLRFLRRKRHIKTARFVVLDVLEVYRRRGIAELLILRTLDFGKNVIGYTAAELSWTQEDNPLRQPHGRGRRGQRPPLQDLPIVRESSLAEGSSAACHAERSVPLLACKQCMAQGGETTLPTNELSQWGPIARQRRLC